MLKLILFQLKKDQRGGKRLIRRGPKKTQGVEKGRFNKKKFINRDRPNKFSKNFNKDNRSH